MVTAPVLEPVGNADEYTLQALQRLQEAATFIRDLTGKQMQRMKKYYDACVKPLQFEEGGLLLRSSESRHKSLSKSFTLPQMAAKRPSSPSSSSGWSLTWHLC